MTISGMYENLDPLPREREQEVARRALGGDDLAVEILVRHNAGFAASEARRFSGWLPAEDLMQHAMVGLLEAAHRYDPDHPSATKFISYAVWWVRRELLRAVAREGHVVPLSEGANQDAGRIASARDALGADAGPAEVAEEAGLDVRRVRQLWNVSSDPVRLNHPAPGQEPDQDRRYESVAADPPPAPPLPVDARDAVQAAVGDLPPRLAMVIRRRFGLDGDTPWTYREISTSMGLSTERVRQLINEALRALGDGPLAEGYGP